MDVKGARSVRQQTARRKPTPKASTASDHFNWLKTYHRQHPAMKAVLILRVSARSQNRTKNLKNHERVLRRRLKHLGIPVIACFHEVGSGWITGRVRDVLARAVHEARRIKGAVFITTSADRFLRSRHFHTQKNPGVLPTEAEFQELRRLACGVPLVTMLHPNMPWQRVRGHQSKWGQRVKGKKGGRPPMKEPGWTIRRRDKMLPRVRNLLAQGKSVTEIARTLRVPRSTVSDWIGSC